MKKCPSTAIERAARAAAIVPMPTLGQPAVTLRRWFTAQGMPRLAPAVKFAAWGSRDAMFVNRSEQLQR